MQHIVLVSTEVMARSFAPASHTAMLTLKPSFVASAMPASTQQMAPFRVSCDEVTNAMLKKGRATGNLREMAAAVQYASELTIPGGMQSGGISRYVFDPGP